MEAEALLFQSIKLARSQMVTFELRIIDRGTLILYICCKNMESEISWMELTPAC